MSTPRLTAADATALVRGLGAFLSDNAEAVGEYVLAAYAADAPPVPEPAKDSAQQRPVAAPPANAVAWVCVNVRVQVTVQYASSPAPVTFRGVVTGITPRPGRPNALRITVEKTDVPKKVAQEYTFEWDGERWGLLIGRAQDDVYRIDIIPLDQPTRPR